jgi:hypothetical protein
MGNGVYCGLPPSLGKTTIQPFCPTGGLLFRIEWSHRKLVPDLQQMLACSYAAFASNPVISYEIPCGALIIAPRLLGCRPIANRQKRRQTQRFWPRFAQDFYVFGD